MLPNFISPKMCVDEMHILANVEAVWYFAIFTAKIKVFRKYNNNNKDTSHN